MLTQLTAISPYGHSLLACPIPISPHSSFPTIKFSNKAVNHKGLKLCFLGNWVNTGSLYCWFYSIFSGSLKHVKRKISRPHPRRMIQNLWVLGIGLCILNEFSWWLSCTLQSENQCSSSETEEEEQVIWSTFGILLAWNNGEITISSLFPQPVIHFLPQVNDYRCMELQMKF